MIVLRSVPSAFLLLVTAIFISHTGTTEARTLGLGNEDFADMLHKRNSWWSKKSVDASPDFTPILPEAEIDASDLAEENSDAYTKLFDCYTTSCVPSFVACATRSRTTSSFEMCKLSHRACAVRCWDFSTSGESPMK